MAHGFLTPESVSGDNFWKNAKDLWDLLQRLKKRKAPPEEVVPAVVSELQNALPPGKEKLLPSGKQQSANKPKALNMLKGSPVTKMLGSGKSEITIKQQLALPPGGPKLPPGASPTGKGGSFTNLPGISSAPKKLDADAFFKAAQTGVHPETGQYLTSDERKNYLKRSKATMNAPASVASAGAAGISSIGEVTKGDEQIVGSVKDLTKVVVSLVNAVKSQTAAQAKAASAQKASAERTANRALASAEESSLEQGSDLSGTITPTYGTNSGTLLPPGAGGGGGGAGGPGFGIGGKAIAQAVGKRGLGRALPRLGAHVAGKTGAKLGAQFGAKAAAKIGAGAVGKSLAKKIPGLGLLAGLGFGAQRLFQGDILGAAGEVASGAASTVPGLGTAASVGIDAALAARDMGVTPFAAGGIISSPTLSMMGEGNKKEGVFPLQGREGKKTFEMFGQGMIDAQKKNSRDFAAIQAKGLRQYYENEDGFKKMGEIFGKIFEGLKDILGNVVNTLLGGGALAATGNPADYLNSGIGGSTAERNAAAFLSTLEGGGGQTAADTFQVMLNRTANAKSGGSMKTYGSTLFDQITAQGQFSPFAAAIYDQKTGDNAADDKYGKIRAKLGKNAAERKAKLLEIAGKPNGLAELQKLFGAGSGSEAAKVLADFESGGSMSKSSAQFVGAAMSFRGYQTSGSRRRAQGGNYFFGAAEGTRAASLNAVSAAPAEGYNGIAAAAQSLKGMSTSGGPGRGSVGCVYAVNKVFAKAGVTPPWGGAQSTDAVINGVRKAGWQQVGFGDARPGDVWVYDANDGRSGHVGIMMPNGKVLSNSTSNRSFTWEADRGQLLSAYPKAGMTPPGGTFYRMPGGGAGPSPSVAASPTKPGKPRTRTKADLIGSAQPANQNNGTAMMATSAQVQMGAMGLTTSGGNVINNIYNTGGQQSSPMGNTLSAGTPSGNAGLSWLALVRR